MNNFAAMDPLQFWSQFISAAPWQALTLLTIGFSTWLIGGHIIMARSLKRRGQSPWAMLLPATWMTLNFSGREWGAIAILMSVSMGFVLAGLVGAQKGMTSNNEFERSRLQRGPPPGAQEIVRPAPATAAGRPAQQDR